MSDELKPCPFCGGEAKEISKGANYVLVGCMSLYCQVGPMTTCYESIDGYNLYAWNTRADNKPILDELAKEAKEKGLYD